MNDKIETIFKEIFGTNLQIGRIDITNIDSCLDIHFFWKGEKIYSITKESVVAVGLDVLISNSVPVIARTIFEIEQKKHSYNKDYTNK